MMDEDDASCDSTTTTDEIHEDSSLISVGFTDELQEYDFVREEPLLRDSADDSRQYIDLGHVYKSPLDLRKYKAIQLSNGLKVVLISTLDLKEKPTKNRGCCHFNKILHFNKLTMGLDPSNYQIKCQCGNESENNEKVQEERKSNLDFASDIVSSIFNMVVGVIDIKTEDAESRQRHFGSGSFSSNESSESDSTDYDDDDPLCASAYLTVGAGWFNDPEDMPGVAHLAEHCFFLGSTKYPFPNQLFRLVIPHDGFANAYTGGNSTVFQIQTSLEIFPLALDMLADGVGYPLLPKQLVNKEIDALDSEFSLRQEDLLKYNQLVASLAKPGHPLRKMDTGNKETLKIPGYYKKLCEWRNKHYCANYMTLALEAPLELDEMEELVLEYFQEIPSSPLPPPTLRVHRAGTPFTKPTFHRIYRVPSIFHSEFIAIHWALDSTIAKNLSVKVLDYLGSVLSYRGEGGIYNLLTHFGLATDVSAAGGDWDADVFSNQFTTIFTIYVDMTETGFKKQEAILQAVFAYISLIAEEGPSLQFFRELQKQHADYFHQRATRESSEYAEDVSLWLQNVDAKYVLVSPELITKFDLELIRECTDSLKIDTCNIMVFSKKYREDEKKLKNMEAFYRTPYWSEEIPTGLADSIDPVKHVLRPFIRMPQPNPYLYEIICCGARPQNLVGAGPIFVIPEKCVVFYKDQKFRPLKGPFPQAKYVFWFHSPLMKMWSAKSVTMIDLLSNMLNEMIEAKFSSAFFAHFRIGVQVTPGKLQVIFTGPSHQLPQVCRDVLKLLMDFERMLDKTAFQIGKQTYIERMDNILLDNRVHAWEILNFLWTNHYQLSSEHVDKIEQITYQDFLDFVKKFKKKMFMAVHLYGFITKEQSAEIISIINGIAKDYPQPITLKEIKALRTPRLPLGENLVKIKSKNPRTPTSVILNGYQFGPLSSKDSKVVDFLVKCMSESAYHYLRTVEQLGYTVLIYHDEVFNVTSIFMELITQPKSFSTDYCNQRMDAFMQDFYEMYLSSELAYQAFLQGKPRTYSFDFERVKRLYENYLLPNPKNYRKISIQVVGNAVDALTTFPLKNQVIMTPNIFTEFEKEAEGSTSKKVKVKKGRKSKSKKGVDNKKGRSLKKSKNTANANNSTTKSKPKFTQTQAKVGGRTTGSRKTKSKKRGKKSASKRITATVTHDNNPPPYSGGGGAIGPSTKDKEKMNSAPNKPKKVTIESFPTSPSPSFILNIHEFKANLKLYPNPVSYRIDYEHATSFSWETISNRITRVKEGIKNNIHYYHPLHMRGRRPRGDDRDDQNQQNNHQLLLSRFQMQLNYENYYKRDKRMK